MLKRIRWFLVNFWYVIFAGCTSTAVAFVCQRYGLLAGLWTILSGIAMILIIAFAYAFISGAVRNWHEARHLLKLIIRGH